MSKTVHPAFGQITLHRWSSSHRETFFGSDLKHDRGITLKICHAELDRRYGDDRVFGKEHIVEVMMTEAQFAQMITTLNIGEGTPVTIRGYQEDGKWVQPTMPKLQAKAEIVTGEMAATCSKATESLTDAMAALDRMEKATGPIKKGDLKAVAALVRTAKMDVQQNLPFVMDQFTATMDKVINDASATIASKAATMTAPVALDLDRTDYAGTRFLSKPTIDGVSER